MSARPAESEPAADAERQQALAELERAIRDSGLVSPGTSGVVLVSGGPDSACAAAGLVAVAGADNVVALTLNYGLRASADRDEAVCVELCEQLGIELVAERVSLPGGNLQAAARDARYAAAEALRARRGAAWIATGHTATDLAETFVYRLAVSPGSRALLGLPERRERLIRPLLALVRERTRELALGAALPFADDETNDDARFARNRIRAELLPVLRELSPAALRNIAETRAQLAEEAELLAQLAAEAIASAGAGATGAISSDALTELEPALRRLVLRELAERVAARPVALSRQRAAEIVRLAASSEGGQLDLGGGLRALCEGGFVSFVDTESAPAPAEASLAVPGRCRFGRWEVSAELRPGAEVSSEPSRATLDAAALGERLVVRAWRDGDRMRPLGLQGTKTLQDLFTDQRIPRSLRRTLPVVVAGERIAWVAGVAVSEEFKLTDRTGGVAILDATLAP